MDKRITVLVKEPCEAWTPCVIDYNLDALQALVGGYIEIVTLWDGVALVVDEEGKLKHKEINFYLPGDIVVGTAALVGTCGDEFCDIPSDVRKMLEGQYSAVKLLTEMTIKQKEAQSCGLT